MKKHVLIIVLMLTGNIAHSQQAVVPCGGNAIGTGGSVSFSVGQVACQANNGPNGSEIQGVQQPWEISVVTEIQEATGIQLSVSVYPNPAVDFLTLSIDNTQANNLLYQVFDAKGMLIEQEKIITTSTIISVSSLASGTYFLNLVADGKNIKTFKIVKQY